MKYPQVSKFLVTGGLAATTEFLTFVMIMSFQALPLLGAQTISFLAGLVVSYSLNRRWVFKSKNNAKREILRYFLLALINIVLTNLLLLILVEGLLLPYILSKVFVMGCVAVWNYIIFQRLIFKNTTF